MERIFKKKYVAVVVGALAIGVGVLSLSPTGALLAPAASLVPFNCVGRQHVGTYSTANAWQSYGVCQPGEVAIASGGQCPGNLRGVSIANGAGYLENSVAILCSSTGNAEWNATCCQLAPTN
jgi:hypothetical protein